MCIKLRNGVSGCQLVCCWVWLIGIWFWLYYGNVYWDSGIGLLGNGGIYGIFIGVYYYLVVGVIVIIVAVIVGNGECC